MAGPARGRGYPEEERLPWAEERRAPARAPAARGLLLGMAGALLLVVLLIAGTWWWMHRASGGGEGDGQLIAAAPGPYKVRPSEPGGMAVEGAGYASYEASEGGDPAGRLDLGAVPEAPVKRPAAKVATPPEEASDIVQTPPPAAPPVAVAGGGTVQLGAFSTEAKANAAWKALSQRFAFLQAFTPVVVPALVGKATVYRLRAPAGSDARRVCGRLTVAGETCQVVG